MAPPPIYGSLAGIRLNAPIVGMARTPDGQGTGWSHPTAESSPSATPPSSDPPAAIRLNQPIVGMASTPERRRLLAGRLRRRNLHLRRRRLLRIHRQPSDSTNPSSAWPAPPTAAATGWSRPTAESSPSATPASSDQPAAIRLNQPIIGIAQHAQRRRLLARRLATAESSRSATPSSTGHSAELCPLARVLGMFTTNNGQGYTLVETDGGRHGLRLIGDEDRLAGPGATRGPWPRAHPRGRPRPSGRRRHQP